MLRIANPGSDIPTFVRVFRELYDALHQFKEFKLDDMSATLVARNLMTSSGYMGSEAIDRGYRDDRGLDAPYNQSKMYSELLRTLGWIHPTDAKLRFKFTLLGAHMATKNPDAVTLIDQCLLGMAVPNPLVKAKAETKQRPFAAILLAADELDGMITRDEIIIGPLSITDDRNRTEWEEMIDLLRSTRGSKRELEQHLHWISEDHNITLVTMRNYTRFPLAVLQDIGWATRVCLDGIYGKNVPFLRLNKYGARTATHVRRMHDMRAADLAKLEPMARDAAIRLGFYQLLERAGFDVAPIANTMAADLETLTQEGLVKNGELLFSPFQELRLKQIVPLLPDITGELDSRELLVERTERHEGLAREVVIPLVETDGAAHSEEPVEKQIRQLAYGGCDPRQIAATLHATFKSATKEEFYPLVASLFRVLGFDCEHSRGGVNYQRYDAIIKDSRASIPIEIKSPSEELYLSVKGVRQALENKIILLSRETFPTERETTSLVVGYNPPNNRAEVAALVEDIRRAFGLHIGIIDFRSLLCMAAQKVVKSLTPDRTTFEKLSGQINEYDT